MTKPVLLLCLAAITATAQNQPTRDQRLQWWREARFGLFIHWGLYAVPAGEWKGKPIPGIGEWIMNRAKIPATFKPEAIESAKKLGLTLVSVKLIPAQ